MSMRAVPNIGNATVDAPIDSLPDDVLAIIFEIARDIPSVYNYHTLPEKHFELVVSQVNRHWRDVALNLAYLWRKIEIKPFQPLELLEAYLTRSSTRLVDIKFTLKQRVRHSKGDPSLQQSLVALIAHVHRWRRFSIHTYSYLTMKVIVDAIHPLTAPNLTHFRVYRFENELQEDASESTFRGSVFTGGAPLLHSVECIGVSMECCWPPLQALTNLELELREDKVGTPQGPMTQSRFVEMLKSVPKVTHLQLLGCIVHPEGTTAPIVELRHLDSLHLDFSWGGDYIESIFSAISSPALSSLTVDDMPEEDVSAFVEVINSSPRSPTYPQLNHLKFNGSGYLEFSYGFFLATPSITHLTFRDCGTVFMPIFSDLVYYGSQPASSVPWSNLRTIQIEPFGEDMAFAFHSFLCERANIGHPLQSLSLNDTYIDDARVDADELLSYAVGWV